MRLILKLNKSRQVASNLHLARFCAKTVREYSNTVATPGHVDITTVDLKQPLPGLPFFKYRDVSGSNFETKITRLPNGLRVATENRFGTSCTIGIGIDSGSRYDSGFASGISHMIEKIAFGSTEKYKSRDDILLELEKYGGICDAQTSRDMLVYAISVTNAGLPIAVNILSEALCAPQVTNEELQRAKFAVRDEVAALHTKPDADALLHELIHLAAYRDNTLGLPRYAPLPHETTVENINRDDIFEYFRRFHTLDRVVLCGVGVNHSELCDLAAKAFDRRPVWSSNASGSTNKNTGDVKKRNAQYTGGELFIERDLGALQQACHVESGMGLPELAHVVLAFETSPHIEPDFVPVCVLNSLMGGGASFSAGGPGKGMYSRLYLNVLNRYYWIHNAAAFTHAYADSGLFCVHASTHPDTVAELMPVISRELHRIRAPIHFEELSRAKRQLQSTLLMNLEQRTVVFEDIVRQVLASGERKPAMHYFDAIEKVTADDLHRVADRMLRSRMSVAALGRLARLPSYKQLTEQFEAAAHANQSGATANRSNSLGRRAFSLLFPSNSNDDTKR